MNPSLLGVGLIAVATVITPAVGGPIIFTVNTAIAPLDSSCDGQDIIVSNAVLTVDGGHSFASLRLASGAVLTHTASSNGVVTFLRQVTDEPQFLLGTNAVALLNPNVNLPSVVVKQQGGPLTYTNGGDYLLGSAGNFTTLQRTETSTIPDGATVLVSYQYPQTTSAGLNLNVAGNLEVESGSSINATGCGFSQGQGLGLGSQAGNPLSGGGGGYGGYGGISSTNAAGGVPFGSPFNPASLGGCGGSGLGGYGGAGGGLVRLIVSSNLVLNGSVVVNGLNATNSRAGGGAGGSIWLMADTISGNGAITANGGAGEPIHGGGGGGGRVATETKTNLFTGTITAFGGNGWQRGGAGTVFSGTNNTIGQMIVDNGGIAGAVTPLDMTIVADLTLQGCALAVISNPQFFHNFLLRSNSSITTTATNNATLVLTAIGDAVVENGANISVTGKGFPANQGTGVGQAGQAGNGAGHGGYGGSGVNGPAVVAGGNYYGSLTSPTTFGSGGRTFSGYSGGAGGGAVRLTVTGKLQLDGKITAEGTSGASSFGGGASGGGVWLSLGGLSGSGTISANGGAGGLPYGGGGAGGRIAVTYSSNSFSGTLTAIGGAGAVAGGAGTIYTKLNNSAYADLIVANGGLSGTNTVLDASGNFSITVRSGAVLRNIQRTLNLGQLTVASASTFLLSPPQDGQTTLTVASNVIIAAGGSISGDGFGFGGGIGTGAGLSSQFGSTGGGHGGYGGRGAGFTNSESPGGNIYDSTASPITAGSGGGGTASAGGAGGGALRITVSGQLMVDGRISANGLNSGSNSAGGGAGGSLYLTLNQFFGSGLITADGGSGNLPNGGGGGGGRIAITWNSNSFTGTYSAKGGNGFVAGGAGTIYLKANNIQSPDLIFDNGGLMGTNTALDVNAIRNLTISSGASVTSSSTSISIANNLTIATSGAWRVGQLTLNVGGAANVATGSVLGANAVVLSGPGNGTSSSLGSSGGGHGGFGGRGAGTALGGNAYDSSSNPQQVGSSGSWSAGGSTWGGYGGGALRMTVSGPLTVNGRISVDGGISSLNNGGGGSGGSIWLTLNQFSGSGTISANGGAGLLPNGGGGGGGRIAIYYNSNSFAGSISARGGNGFVAGGAGTVYLKANNQPNPNLIADNGGLIGTNTVIDISTISNLTITGGAIVRPSLPTLSLSNLAIASNSTLLASSSGGTLTLNISGSANIAQGGSVSSDGLGFTSGLGISGGAGQLTGGGGHGGFGGSGIGPAAGGSGAGGNAYDSLPSPILAGSGGNGSNLSGGAGGGTLRLNVSGPTTLEGRISANGMSSSTNSGGGGAGGSVWLTLDELIGNGVITADGGIGHLPNGGGGGGGRVSVSYNFLKGNSRTNGFIGTMSARGGAGYVKGGAGTIFVRTNNSNVANVFADNGGTRGTNTLVSGIGTFDLFVYGGAVATGLGSPRDLFVRSNSWVGEIGNVSVLRNATFDAGGGINLDGVGISTAGSGSTVSSPKGGGGHGGYGAQNPPGAGGAYDSATLPVLSGSPGGNGSGTQGYPFGGKGGGALHLTVGGTLLLNGQFSATGLDGYPNSGGGSGGSLWLQTGTFAGDGLVTATGGDGNGTAGGGGGGRIAVYFNTNQFTGLLSACGGAGGLFGGAGTIYTRNNLTGLSSLELDNCGNLGAATPLSQTFGFATNLTVTARAVAEMQGAIPTFSNLVVSTDGVVTSGRTDTNLFLALLGNLTVAERGGIITDARGFMRDSGPGAGATLSNQGGGGSYGGWGGDSASGAYGGMIYGSPARPVDRGSGGGSGSGFPAAGSEGGGAVRLVVAGTVELNGLISSSGGLGWQDDSGGGSGGSVWISTRKFTGSGTLAAVGGDGDFFGGGGGGGGRIAIYSPTNTFTGLVSVIGGDGANFGEAGTVFNSGSLSGFDVVWQTPTGGVSNVVNQVALEFTEPVNLASVAAGDVRIYTPYGLLPPTNQTFSLPAPSTLLVSFNSQNVPGNYRVEVGPLIEGLLAPRMSQVYTGAFSINLPMISGTVTNMNGQPVSGVMLLPGDGLMSATTDANGNYSLGVPPAWVGVVTPVLGTNMFVPGQLSYAEVAASVTGQNFLMVATIAPRLNSGLSGTNLFFNWNGIPGVTYQPESSTNLVDWLPYGQALSGTNGLMQLLVPTSGNPMEFVRVRSSN